MGLAYTPGADAEEVRAVFALAAARRVPVFVHIGEQQSVGDLEPLEAVIGHAKATGAALHVVHINSSSRSAISEYLARIEQARASGLDVTTEAYPYTAGSTQLESALFDEGWRVRRGIDYGDLQWVATGERLTAETFERYRAQGGTVIIHMMQPEWIETAVGHPLVMIAADGMPMVPGAHPRGAGTHARVLGYYTRERGVITLMQAIAKLSLMPAQRLEAFVPAMAGKGRIRVGADADLTLFDAASVTDRATFDQPLQHSEGIAHVLVAGTFVVRDGVLVEGAFPGVPLRGDTPGAH
jgi:dihydroorotase